MKYTRLVLFTFLLLTACTAPVVDSGPVPTTVAPEPGAPTAAEPTATPVPAATPTTEPLAAMVNGQPITMDAYQRQVSRYEASMVAAGQDLTSPEGQEMIAQGHQWVLDMMVEQALIEQQAATEGIVVTDGDVDANIEALKADIGEEDFNTWLTQEDMTFDEMRERLRGDMIATQMANSIAETIPTHAEHVHARHILVATEEEARQILGQLQAGADFATLARTYSQDISTRDLGGDLGFFPQGVLTSKEVEAAAFALQPGQLSDVIQSDLGYHIVQVVDRVADQEISPENLRLLRDQAVQSWLGQLKASADIQVFVTP